MEPITPEELEQYKMVLRQAGFSDEQLAMISPEQVQAIYADYAGEQGAIDQQRAQAEALRGATQRGQGGTMAGSRVFVADNPLETLAGIGGEFVSASQQRKANERQEAMNKMRSRGQLGTGMMGANTRLNVDPRAQLMREEEEEEERYGGRYSSYY
jgi:hypothetical protein